MGRERERGRGRGREREKEKEREREGKRRNESGNKAKENKRVTREGWIYTGCETMGCDEMGMERKWNEHMEYIG